MGFHVYVVVLVIAGCGNVKAPQSADAPTTCSPETDAAFCGRLDKTCESVTDTDNCGQARTAVCGTCSGAKPACVANVCAAPVCGTSFMAAPGTTVTSVTMAGKQSALLGASASGQSVLYLQATSLCVTTGPASLTIGDEAVAGTLPYVTQSLDAVANLGGFSKGEETMTITADGLTIIGVATGGLSFSASKRSAVGATDFALAAPGDFVNINAALPASPASVSWPLLSADGLAFYYRVAGASDITVNGVYEALRASTAMPFPSATLMPGAVQTFDSISGISSDRMTVFVTKNFGTSLLTRDSLSQPFTAPTMSTPPGAAFRVVPIAGCTAIGTCEPGGCQNEAICTWANQ